MTTPMPPLTLPVYRRRLEVWRAAIEDDGAGGQVEARVMIGEVAAQVSQPTATERVEAAQAGASLTHVLHFDPGEDVRRGDELRGEGEVFRVDATVQPSHAVYLRANVERVQAEQPEEGAVGS